MLRPADPQAELGTLLRRLAQRIPEPVQVHLELEPLDLSREQTETLYRVAQEAVHNALKHAEARHIWLRLERRRGAAMLSVEDDGKGLGEAQPPGLGLPSLRARAERLGGSLTLTPRKGGGLRLEVRLPWRG